MINCNDEIFKNLCVVSAPSGAGKTSLIKKISSHQNISVSISETTRNPRTGEQIQIAASQKVKFLPAKALKEVFNK